MAWQNEMTIITRTLINDLNDPYEFSDDRIKQLLTVSAKYVQFDVNLEHSYTIDVVNNIISPDPTDDNDSIFISLTCLKAACLVDQSTLRTKAAIEGIRASLGPASLSVAGSLVGIKLLLDTGPCATYEELTSHWDVKEDTAIRAVLSPFVGNKFVPFNMGIYPHSHREFLS
jgi:hypothetical protein